MRTIFTLLLLVLCSFSFFAQTEKEKVITTVEKNTIKGHIYFLADNLLNGRETGTQENKIAASYIANSFRSYGVKPNPETGTYYQQFNLKKIFPPKRSELAINRQPYADIVVIQPVELEFSGEAVFVGYGLESDYKDKEVKGKLVIIKGGSPEASDINAVYGLKNEKASLAQKAGVVGIIEFIETDERTWMYIKRNFEAPKMEIENGTKAEQRNSYFPYVWALNKKGVYSNEIEDSPSLNAKLIIQATSPETVGTQNVIGIVEGTDPTLKEEYVIYSAHYDHVGIGNPDETGDNIYNGARDNAVGVTTVLSMAQHLSKYPTKRSALFILFTAEEKGLLGSKYYVENPILPLKQMVFCFNSDNGGYNDTSLATIVGLGRTTAEKNIQEAAVAFGLTAIDDPAPEQGLFDRSDNVHFALKGIPAPTFSMGFTEFNSEITKYYHQPGDHADSLDYDYLEKFFRAYVMSGRNIGNDPAKPVWIKGDKYEEESKRLYGN